MKRCEEVYEFEEIIGEGTFSNVVRGVHNDTKTKYAIKIIDKSQVSTEKQKWRIRNEIMLHKKCKHPYIAHFVEYYESDTDICIVMELCEGGELFNRIVEKGCFSEKDASRVMRQIVSAVQFLHGKGIVHRDIKPENLLYTNGSDESDIKLADFGLAKELETSSGRAMLKASLSGTPAYCAPERLNEEQESKAVDMWSLGCILYFLLFGVPPFYSQKEDEEECDDEIIGSVMAANITFPEGRAISDMAKDLLLRLLEKDPTKRITAEEVLAHPWLKSLQPKDNNDQYGAPVSKAKSGGKDDRAFLKSSINRIIDIGERVLDTDEDKD
jgi:calcium/calmodulin-dependent protein kinase I